MMKTEYRFVKNEPAILISADNKRFLVIADVHLGLTYELEYKGVNIPNQKDDLLEKIYKLKKLTRADNLVIVGDAKHALPGTPHEERKEVREFFEGLCAKFKDVILIKGNHDTLIEEILPRLKVKDYMIVNKCLLTHGHQTLPHENYDVIIMGHKHPVVKFRDKAGGVFFQRCWIRDTITIDENNLQVKKKLIIMPAFNAVLGGKPVNEDYEFSGPVAKYVNTTTAKAFLLDGTDLGNINDLELRTLKKHAKDRDSD